MLANALPRRRAFVPLVAALVLVAWATLVLWELGPYGRYLDHGNWTEAGIAAALCRVLPGGSAALSGLLYVGGWVLMVTAMMLPSTLPLIGIFDRVTSGRPDRTRLLGLLIVGYLLVWGAFGIAAHLLDAAVHAGVAATPWLALNGWAVGAAVLAAAGAFQFSTLKYRCLDQCRTPFSFVNQHWRGRAARREAFFLGAHHGLFCVGCCWALMFLMFVVGTGSVGWMLALGAVMALEKNVAWGRRLAAPLGAVLVACALAVAALNLAS